MQYSNFITILRAFQLIHEIQARTDDLTYTAKGQTKDFFHVCP